MSEETYAVVDHRIDTWRIISTSFIKFVIGVRLMEIELDDPTYILIGQYITRHCLLFLYLAESYIKETTRFDAYSPYRAIQRLLHLLSEGGYLGFL